MAKKSGLIENETPVVEVPNVDAPAVEEVKVEETPVVELSGNAGHFSRDFNRQPKAD